MISSKIKDLWVRFMQALTMRNYCCFNYLRNIPELILSDKECNKYPNFCDFKVATFLAELEFMQFAWYCGFCKSDHITPVLYDSIWLPVELRVHCKVFLHTEIYGVFYMLQQRYGMIHVMIVWRTLVHFSIVDWKSIF